MTSRLLQAFPADRGYSRVDFSREPMPQPVAHFLAQTLQSRLDIELERHRSIRSDWFDYDHPDVQHAQLTFGAMLGQHARIPKQEWARMLGEAVFTTLSYLVRPVPTLVDFLFDDEETVPIRDVYRGLAFFGPYPYLREVATSYLRQKSMQEVERSRLLAVLRHSDREITRDYDATAWLRLLTPLFTMLETAHPDAERSVPVELLDAFFEDKEAGHIFLRLRDLGEEPGRRFTEDALRELLSEPARPLIPPPSLEPEPVALPEPPPLPTSVEPPAAPVRPEIRRILGPLDEEPAAPPHSQPAPEPAPVLEEPVAEVTSQAEQPAPEPEPEPEPERPVPAETAASVEEPESEAEHAAPSDEQPESEVEHPAPSDGPPASTEEAPVFVPSLEARIKAAQAPSLAAARAAGGVPPVVPLKDIPPVVPSAPPTPPPAAPAKPSAPPVKPSAPPVESSAPPVIPVPSPEPPAAPPVRPAAPAVSPAAPPATPNVPPAAPRVPLWQQFQKGSRPPSVPTEPRPIAPREPETPPRGVQRPIYPVAPEPQSGSKGVPLWQQFRKPLAPHPMQQTPPPKNLGPLEETVLGEAHPPNRNLYINELFSGSVAEYERVLQRLQTAASWSHASQIIAEEVFRKHQVNIYSEAAIAFTNAVEEQYRE